MLLGINAKCYRNTGSWGSPTWSEVTCISDFTLPVGWDTVEAPTRASRVKSGARTLVALNPTGKLKSSVDEENYLAFWEALMAAPGSAEEELDLLILNGPHTTNGCRGYRGMFIVTKGDEDQGLGNALFNDIALMPSAFATASEPFSSAVVTAGAPVYTAL